MVGTSTWPNRVGLNLARHTMVICSMRGPVWGTNLLGYGQTSQSIQGVWHYSVALTPVTNLQSNWILVESVNPSQLIPLGMSDAVPGLMLNSTARLASANFRYKPVPPQAWSIAPSSRPSRKKAAGAAYAITGQYDGDGGSLHYVGDLQLPAEYNTPSVAQNHIAKTTIGNTSHTLKKPVRTVIPAISDQQPTTFRRNTPAKGTSKAPVLDTKEAMKPDRPVSLHIRKEVYYKICCHGRRETACILCKGGSVCVHSKQRYWCKECGGKAWCEHGKQKSRCVQCGGTGICLHGKLRARCKDCMNAMPSK